ncbi:hypothetical protein SRHO_G00023950 [Serrasalmus rhombeus]
MTLKVSTDSSGTRSGEHHHYQRLPQDAPPTPPTLIIPHHHPSSLTAPRGTRCCCRSVRCGRTLDVTLSVTCQRVDIAPEEHRREPESALSALNAGDLIYK